MKARCTVFFECTISGKATRLVKQRVMSNSWHVDVHKVNMTWPFVYTYDLEVIIYMPARCTMFFECTNPGKATRQVTQRAMSNSWHVDVHKVNMTWPFVYTYDLKVIIYMKARCTVFFECTNPGEAIDKSSSGS